MPRWAIAAALTIAARLGARNTILYVVGGNNGGVLSTLEAYNPATGTWTALAPLPGLDGGDAGRAQGSVAVLDGKLYVVGGWRYHPPLPTATTNMWSTKASPRQRQFQRCRDRWQALRPDGQ